MNKYILIVLCLLISGCGGSLDMNEFMEMCKKKHKLTITVTVGTLVDSVVAKCEIEGTRGNQDE